METVRSFAAIELPGELKQELVALVDRMRSGGQTGVRWVDPNGIHLTLKFLGDVAVERLDDVTGALRQATRGIPRFRLAVAGLGVFPNARTVRVAWVGVSGQVDVLEGLQQRVASALVPLGFAAEARGFTPHLTLARVRDGVSPEQRQSFGQLMDGVCFEARHGIEVDSVNLMKSQLTSRGAIYSRISSVELERA